MAKDLPYFKFFCSEWSDGDICLENFETQGLFINLCAYYWSNECDLEFNKAKKKFRNASTELWDILLDSNIIKDIDGQLVISFLDEQMSERKHKSKQASEAGKISAEKRRLAKLEQEFNDRSTTVENSFNESSTNKRRKEEKREEKRKEEKSFEERKKAFIKWFNESKLKYTGVMGKSRTIAPSDINNLKTLFDAYEFSDFEKAIPNLFKNDWAKETGNLTISHFIKIANFNKYLEYKEPTKKNAYDI